MNKYTKGYRTLDNLDSMTMLYMAHSGEGAAKTRGSWWYERTWLVLQGRL